jgi:hypothetical protein
MEVARIPVETWKKAENFKKDKTTLNNPNTIL